MISEPHDFVLYLSKTWGAVYLLGVFLLAAAWIYWPKRRFVYDRAAQSPLGSEDIQR
ncbi:MAG: cbb3-type cytochrome c oxidase subunit 3 [Rhodobacteraceae bacterium]|nr:cbb3-type cytochrome c oxidase subunit 3 [Paracoccaceae bacterium]